MLTIALTGGIGSGKSHVAAIWAGLGAHVVDADQVAREVLSGGQIREAIKRRWGDGVVKAEGTLNREALAAIVFQDPAERAASTRSRIRRFGTRSRAKSTRLLARILPPSSFTTFHCSSVMGASSR